jgi:hypothetical protein
MMTTDIWYSDAMIRGAIALSEKLQPLAPELMRVYREQYGRDVPHQLINFLGDPTEELITAAQSFLKK